MSQFVSDDDLDTLDVLLHGSMHTWTLGELGGWVERLSDTLRRERADARSGRQDTKSLLDLLHGMFTKPAEFRGLAESILVEHGRLEVPKKDEPSIAAKREEFMSAYKDAQPSVRAKLREVVGSQDAVLVAMMQEVDDGEA